MRSYDIEFYSARVTDIWIFDVTNHSVYETVVEALRETPFWDRYFEVLEILPGVENVVAKDFGRAAERAV
ncbi:MAG: hypothetical protein SC7H9.05 [uncultured Paraburkholderia sp.]|nr:MAG: hypothetical protein SC7H9.05 [uncultured Paraburkholderia sp.]CAH2911325.1 MAG: hypothetical protein SC7H9.05 [uncultured Paraburkholderia sp.]